MKILITGGLGFVGSHLVDLLLEEKHKIIILTKSYSKKQNVSHKLKKIKIEKVDITNFKKLSESIENNMPDVIIHLAGITSHSESFEKPMLDVDTNAKSTLFILEEIRKNIPKCKFILGSTFIVIGRPKKLPVDELTSCQPTTIYGANRLASEYYCKIYHEMYGLNTNIFRITNSFGPREQIIPKKNAVNFLLYNAYKGKEVRIFNHGKFFRDLIYVSDVVSGINTILKKGKPGHLYWISSGKKTWFYNFAKLLRKHADCKIKYVPSPNYTKKVDVGNFVVNNSKLKSLGWKPSVSLENGVQETFAFFNANNL